MNKISKILTFFVLAGILLLNSCVKEKFDAPDIKPPTNDFSANKTIAQLNLLCDSFAGTPATFGQITWDFTIEGTVAGNDESGNIYKNIYIEDTTGGIDIAINQSGLYTSYRVGQKILVKCKGLYIGRYGAAAELGYTSNGAIYFMPAIFMKDHIFLDGFAINPPTPKLKTIPTLTTADYSTLIRLDSVYFVSNEVGKPYADPNVSATDRTLMDKNGNSVVIRTSSYANFAGKLIPSKMGSIVGIYSYYTAGQIFLRDTNDLINFTQTPPIFLSEAFTSTLGSFTPYSITGTEAWAITSYGVTMSGYTAGNHANEDWLISSSFNLNNYTNPILTFNSAMHYGSAGDGSLKLYYSTDYTSGLPSTATWTELAIPTLPDGSSWTPVSSGNINLSAATGTNVHIAFKYTSTTSSAATWEITSLLGKGTPN